MLVNTFEPVFDRQDRIEAFRPSGSDELIAPHLIGEDLDGNERITLEGLEFNLTERGNLIACGVEMPRQLTIGFGVYVGPGVRFIDEGERQEVAIGSHSRIGSQDLLKIGSGVEIGKRAIVAARAISHMTDLASTYAASGGALEEKAEIGSGVSIGPETEIGLGVRIGSGSSIGSHVEIADGTYLESDITVADRVDIGNHCHLAFTSMIGEQATLQSGVYVDLRARVDSYAIVERQALVPKDSLYATV
jgi:UDP-3-O-[3-hydroxymyristoyl] glucosamine N-acyltransferase